MKTMHDCIISLAFKFGSPVHSQNRFSNRFTTTANLPQEINGNNIDPTNEIIEWELMFDKDLS